MIRLTVLFFSIALPTVACENVNAWLNHQQQAGLISVTAFASCECDGVFRFQLSMHKTGKSGRSHTRQSGQFELAPDQQHRLANLKFNPGQDDRYQIQLRVFGNGELVAEDELSIP